MQPDDYAPFFSDFMGESDRAALVLGAAQMDALLADILEKRLIAPKNKLFDFNGPFGTFSARIDTAHAVGAIDKSFADKLHLVRMIRNKYAHNIQSIDLNGSVVSQQIGLLSAAFEDSDFWSEKLDEAGRTFGKSGNSLTLRFAIALLIMNLAMVVQNVREIDGSEAKSVFCPH